ncbi:aminoglycoside phosphotransferase family protein [Bacillus sp. AK031]
MNHSKIEQITGSIHSIIVLEDQGCTSEVRRINSDKGTFILKSSFKKKYREWLQAEARVLQMNNQENNISMPTFYGFYEEVDSSHLIMSFEEGQTLRSALRKAASIQEKKWLAKSFGSFLNQLHEGHLTDEAIHTWLDEQLRKSAIYLAAGEADGTLALLQELKENKPAPVKQTLIHGDCTTDNVIVTEGEVSMFIDVAGMTNGDPRYDESLAIGRFKGDSVILEAFYEGYTRYRVSEEEYRYFNEGLYEFF